MEMQITLHVACYFPWIWEELDQNLANVVNSDRNVTTLGYCYATPTKLSVLP